MRGYKVPIIQGDTQREFLLKYIEGEDELFEVESQFKANPGMVVGLDLETGKNLAIETHKDGPQHGLDPRLSYIRLMQLCFGDTVYVLDTRKVRTQALKKFFTDNPSTVFAAHYGMFERKHLLHTFGIEPKIECTMVMAQSIGRATEPNFAAAGFGIAAVSKRFLNIAVDKFYQESDWDAPVLSNEQIVYAGIDAYIAYLLHPVLLKKIHDLGVEKSWKAIRACAPAICEMEYNGVAVDWKKHAELVGEWITKKASVEATIEKYFPGVNTNSGKQMAAWLESKASPQVLQSWPKTEKGAYSFSSDALDNYRKSPAIAALIEFKEYNKMLSTYGESLASMQHPTTQRLHTSYTENQTATSRLSSREPNQQNYPRDPKFRSLFVPREGYVFVIADYSQIEMRIQAEVSRDKNLLEVFASGRDSYTQFAAMVYHKTYEEMLALGKKSRERQLCKNTLLGLGYGMGPTKLMHYIKVNAGIEVTEDEARKLWHDYHHRLVPGYSQWCTRQRTHVEANGRVVSTVLGCKRKLSHEELFTCAVNQVIQGTGAEVMRVGTVYVKAAKDKAIPASKLTMSVHDELVMEVPIARAEEGRKLLEDNMLKGWAHVFPKGVMRGVVDAKICTDWSLKD